MVALAVVDAKRSQEVDGRVVADELGDGAGVQALGDRNDGLDDELVGRRGAEVADELTVDLEVIELEVLARGRPWSSRTR